MKNTVRKTATKLTNGVTVMTKKLIEVALPLEAINAESAREKSIRHGHPSTLHLWWARRPLAAARAVIFSSLIDDPDQEGVPQALLDRIDTLPLEDKYKPDANATIAEVRRNKLFGFIEKLVKWENSNNPAILETAKHLIHAATNGNPPPLLDPFAGGGAIPLEAQRLGLEAHASDLNPVAVMINKAMIEIPPKFAGQPPVNPEARGKTDYTGEWKGAQGLAEDVRYYGEWMKKEAFKRIGHLYPKVKVPEEQGGGEATVIAWIWARTVKCPNPACGCEMPLANSFELSKKKGREAYIQPIIEGNKIRYEVKHGKNAPEPPKIARGKFKCIVCGEPTPGTHIKVEGRKKRIESVLMAIVAEGKIGRLYISPDNAHQTASDCLAPSWEPDGELLGKAADQLPLYGYSKFSDLFTNRQLTALTTFSDLVVEAQMQLEKDGGSREYAQAVGVYLAFAVDKGANYWSTCCAWHTSAEKMMSTFGRQAIPMVWDYTEANPFSNSSGNWILGISQSAEMCDRLGIGIPGIAIQHNAQSDNGLRDIMVSTDPPYYDNIGYADLSDFFYIWLRQSLKNVYPDLCRTMLVPKSEELVATPYRFDGGRTEARLFFENGMLRSFKQINAYVRKDVPMTVYYAYRQSKNDDRNKSSTGWETMLSAMIQAGFTLVGTWPIRTELTTALKGNVNALASSIVLVCRKRPTDALVCTRRDFINNLKRELKPALAKLQASNIAPVDLAQSAIGPGMGVYSRFSKVLEADGTPMSVRSALQIINQELDLYFTEQDSELDRDSRFCIDLFSQYAFNEIKFGDADVLARAKNTSVAKLAGQGILYAQKGVVRLLGRDEIPDKIERGDTIIWLLTQQLTRALEKDGVLGAAKIVADIFTSEPEQAKSLAYRLFTIADRKSWAQEAYAYNSLVIAWPEVQSKAAELQAANRTAKPKDLFDNVEE
jgi:putative DNA methylase